MENIKEKLLDAVNDGALDAGEVVDKLLCYIDEDTVQDIIENEGWDEACGLGKMAESDDDM
jgi:hypothetical protein